MKYLNAFLRGQEISPYPREEEPQKPLKPVSAVSAGASPRGTGEMEQAEEQPSPAWPREHCGNQAEIKDVTPSRQEAPADYRTLYQEKTSEIPADFPLVDAWLVDAHPALWRQIRELDDELSRLEQQGIPEATYRAKLNELVSFCQEVKALREGHWDMLLVKSVVLGSEPVWVVKDEEQARAVMGDGKAVYYAEEFELLKAKTPEQIRDIHKAKLAFPGCRVVQ